MKQILWILLLSAILALSLAGLIPIPKTKSNLPQPNPLVNARILPKKSPDVRGKNLQLANFMLVGDKTLASASAVCSGNVAVNFLLDISTSMNTSVPGGDTRLDRLKTAVKNVAQSLSLTEVIAAQEFGPQVKEIFGASLVDIGNLAKFNKTIDYIVSKGGTGLGTPTDDGLNLAKSSLTKSIAQFPDKRWTLLLMTDGCPNDGPDAESAARSLKTSLPNVKLITIGIDIDGKDDKCKKIGGLSGTTALMRRIASTPADYIQATSGNLLQISQTLTQKACN